MKNRINLTTGEVAKLCGVAPRTASKWIDSGKLPGFRVPMSSDRRVTREDLAQFLRDNHMDAALAQLEGTLSVMLVAVPEDIARCVEIPDRKILRARDAFEAGILFQSNRSEFIFIDFTVGTPEAMAIARHISSLPVSRLPRIAAAVHEDTSLSTDEHLKPYKDAGFSRVIKMPYTSEHIVATLNHCVQRSARAVTLKNNGSAARLPREVS